MTAKKSSSQQRRIKIQKGSGESTGETTNKGIPAGSSPALPEVVRQTATVSLVDQKTGQQIVVNEPHVIVPVRHLKPGVAISQAWHASHYPGCWEVHVDCARVRLTELFSAATNFVGLFQAIPPALETLQPQTRHLYALRGGELMAAIAKCAFPEMKGIKVPSADDDLEAIARSIPE